MNKLHQTVKQEREQEKERERESGKKSTQHNRTNCPSEICNDDNEEEHYVIRIVQKEQQRIFPALFN